MIFQDDGRAGVSVQPPLQGREVRAAEESRASSPRWKPHHPGHLRQQQLQLRRQGEWEHGRDDSL